MRILCKSNILICFSSVMPEYESLLEEHGANGFRAESVECDREAYTHTSEGAVGGRTKNLN